MVEQISVDLSYQHWQTQPAWGWGLRPAFVPGEAWGLETKEWILVRWDLLELNIMRFLIRTYIWLHIYIYILYIHTYIHIHISEWIRQIVYFNVLAILVVRELSTQSTAVFRGAQACWNSDFWQLKGKRTLPVVHERIVQTMISCALQHAIQRQWSGICHVWICVAYCSSCSNMFKHYRSSVSGCFTSLYS